MSGTVGRGSGNVFLPGSNDPFRPINPHGRTMPSPARPYRPLRPAMYQVEVDLRKGGTERVGPMWQMEDMAEATAAAINRMLALKPMHGWGRARVVLAKPAEVRDTRTIRELLMEK